MDCRTTNRMSLIAFGSFCRIWDPFVRSVFYRTPTPFCTLRYSHIRREDGLRIQNRIFLIWGRVFKISFARCAARDEESRQKSEFRVRSSIRNGRKRRNHLRTELVAVGSVYSVAIHAVLIANGISHS